jgi:hypothetical protein
MKRHRVAAVPATAYVGSGGLKPGESQALEATREIASNFSNGVSGSERHFDADRLVHGRNGL